MGEITTTSYTPKEILADGCMPHAIPVTLAADVAALAAGTVIAKRTVGGLYAPYDDAEADGTEVAVGILAEDADPAGEGRAIPVPMYVSGSFVEANLIGLDANAKTDLKSRSIEGRLIIPGA